MAGTAIFNGSSRYSTDFQAVTDRAVAIASLPLQQLNRQRSTLQAQASALSGIENRFTAVRTAMEALKTATTSAAPDLATTGAAIAKATAVRGAPAGDYRLSVLDVGAATTTLSRAGSTTVANPATQGISTESSLTLTVAGASHTLTPANSSLSALAESINAVPDSGVRAVVLNVNTGGQPDYRLSLQSTRLGDVAISLSDTGPLLDTVTVGKPARYKLNGIGTEIESASRTATLAPGLTVDLAAVGDATITVADTGKGLRTALNGLVSTFNATLDELDQQRGKNGGALTGQSIVGSLGSALRDLAGAGSPGEPAALERLGIRFNDQGRLTFDDQSFTAAMKAGTGAARSWLEGTDGEGGFLAAASRVLDGVQLGESGALSSFSRSLQDSLTSQDRRISEADERVTLLRDNLTARLAAADALIASLEQQVSYMTNLFESMSQSSRS